MLEYGDGAFIKTLEEEKKLGDMLIEIIGKKIPTRLYINRHKTAEWNGNW
ncbi:MAG: hypothetical protein ACRYE9_04520 [Janthinobacterium lividum]